jgi:Rrf2 family protein
MIQLTKSGEYGMRAISFLVAHGYGNMARIGQISKAKGIPEPFLRKLFKPLVAANIIETTRGVAGGVRLKREPSEITILEVVEALEGPISLNECLINSGSCAYKLDCGMHDVWRLAQDAIDQVLTQHDITHLLKSH